MPEPTMKSPRGDRIEKVAFVSLGCPKNLVDSEKMLGALVASGLGLVSDHDAADAVVINTCGFLEEARAESLEVIGDALRRKREGSVKRVVVTGCLVQRHRARLLEWAPGIDAMIGVFDRDRVVDAVTGRTPRRTTLAEGTDRPRYWIAGNALQAAAARGRNTAGLTVNGTGGTGIGYFEDDNGRFRLTPRHWAYLRVSEGCNQRCAFCTIPSIRGKMRSKPLTAIASEARQLMADGVFELNLIGQDTTSFGEDIGYDGAGEGLVGLLAALDGVAAEAGHGEHGPGGWVRLMYAYPSRFTDEMIEAIAGLPRIVKYIDLPLQHISERMLARMRRRITRAGQETLLHKLRERIPGLAIRTTFITGFPGEREADHEELLRFIEAFQFDMLGVFRYSREAGTPAGTMDLDPELHVPEEVKTRREAELMLTHQRIAFENAKYVAETRSQFDVLIDGPTGGPGTPEPPGVADSGGPVYAGRCYHQAPQVDSLTYVRSAAPLAAGELVRCTIIDADGYDLVARPTAELEGRPRLTVLGQGGDARPYQGAKVDPPCR